MQIRYHIDTLVLYSLMILLSFHKNEENWTVNVCGNQGLWS